MRDKGIEDLLEGKASAGIVSGGQINNTSKIGGMGAWGIRPFQNDAACDWGIRLIDEHSIDFLEASLDQEEYEGHYLESPGACRILAVAEVVYGIVHGPRELLPDEVVEWILEHRDLDVSDLSVRVISRIERVMGADSELQQLWAENETDLQDWEADCNALVSGLRDAPATRADRSGAAKKRKPRNPPRKKTVGAPLPAPGRICLGDVLAIPLGDGLWGYVRSLRDVSFAILHSLSEEKILQLDDLIGSPALGYTGYCEAWNRPTWVYLGQWPFDDEDQEWAPPKWSRDGLNPNRFQIYHHNTMRYTDDESEVAGMSRNEGLALPGGLVVRIRELHELPVDRKAIAEFAPFHT